VSGPDRCRGIAWWGVFGDVRDGDLWSCWVRLRGIGVGCVAF